MSGLDAAQLLIVFDQQLRGSVPDRVPAGVQVERDGPLVIFFGGEGGGFVDYRDLGEREGEEVDELIARCVRAFAERGERFEWKLYGHDRPADLPQRLQAAGFVPEERETVVIAPVEIVAAAVRLPPGVGLREVTARADLDRIAAFEETVWADDRGWLAGMLEAERAVDPDALSIVVAESEGAIVCAGWVRFLRGTQFASLWGGSTLPEWRGQGIYRALTAARARAALADGVRYINSDCTVMSRPILERSGLVAVTTTTPYVWKR